jgi:hypothetical protein
MKKKQNKFLEFIKEFVPLLLAAGISVALQREWLIAGGIVLTTAIAFYFKYYKGEWKLFWIATLGGLILEVGGDSIYKLQYWSEGSLPYNIPIWLPLFWGWAAVIIRRIGDKIVKEK